MTQYESDMLVVDELQAKMQVKQELPWVFVVASLNHVTWYLSKLRERNISFSLHVAYKRVEFVNGNVLRILAVDGDPVHSCGLSLSGCIFAASPSADLADELKRALLYGEMKVAAPEEP